MKPFTAIAVFLFAIICVAHILRLVMGWTVNVNGVDIGPWASIIAVLLSALMAFMVWRENK